MHSWHSDFISQVRFFVFWEINFIAANKRSQVLEVDKWKYLDQSWAMLAIISLYSLVSLVVISKPCTNQSHFCLRKISKYYICVYINICNAKVVCSALLNDSCMWFSLQKQSLVSCYSLFGSLVVMLDCADTNWTRRSTSCWDKD